MNSFHFQLIISSDSLPFGNTQDPRQPQVPNVQPNYSSQQGQPQYQGQNQGPQTPSQNQNPVNPFLTNSNQTPAPVPTPVPTVAPTPGPINCNDYPQHPMCGETIILGTTTTQAPGMKKIITEKMINYKLYILKIYTHY